MRDYSQQELEDLIACPKRVTEPPRKDLEEARGHKRNRMGLTSVDGQHDFFLFIRVNSTFAENFSVGLTYISREDGRELALLRCNGSHGDINRSFAGGAHFTYHVHRTEAARVNAGENSLAEATETTAFATLDEAIACCCRGAHIQGWEQHFPRASQVTFPWSQS